MNPTQREQWVVELMIDEATQGLCLQEELELETLLSEQPMADEERYAFQRAATACEMAFALEGENSIRRSTRGSLPPLASPPSLDRKLEKLIESFSLSSGLDNVRRIEPATAAERGPSSTSTRARLLAVAAIILAAIAWWPKIVALLNVEETLQPMTEEADFGLVLDMQGTEDIAGSGASGRLLWDPVRQEGLMRIAGLEINDATLFQYQLWIFDAGRDARHPVDGGVFDMKAADDGGFVTIHIDARLPVENPTLFAITVERPGGVVVSQRERIVMTAAVS